MNTTYCANCEHNPTVTSFGFGSLGWLKNQVSTRGAVWEVLEAVYCRLLQRIAIRSQQKIDRQAFETMLGLDDALLNDIGVTRDAVRWAAQLPLKEDAAIALRQDMNNSAG